MGWHVDLDSTEGFAKPNDKSPKTRKIESKVSIFKSFDNLPYVSLLNNVFGMTLGCICVVDHIYKVLFWNYIRTWEYIL